AWPKTNRTFLGKSRKSRRLEPTQNTAFGLCSLSSCLAIRLYHIWHRRPESQRCDLKGKPRPVESELRQQKTRPVVGRVYQSNFDCALRQRVGYFALPGAAGAASPLAMPITPIATRPPASPVGWVFRSSSFA